MAARKCSEAASLGKFQSSVFYIFGANVSLYSVYDEVANDA